jgi:hypothetical protein
VRRADKRIAPMTQPRRFMFHTIDLVVRVTSAAWQRRVHAVKSPS